MFFNGFQTFVGLGFAVICTGAVSSSCIYAEDTPPITITRSETPAYEFSAGDEKLLDQIQRGCFNYLWKEVGVPAKLAKDRRFTAVASMAGVGFQLASLPIGSSGAGSRASKARSGPSRFYAACATLPKIVAMACFCTS